MLSLIHISMCIRDRHYGARPVKRYLPKHVETELASMIISGDIVDGQTIRIDSDGKELKITAR